MAYASIAREFWGPRSTAPEVVVTPEVAPAASLTYYDGLQEGMTQRDIGRGKYEILGADGAVMGTGYKDVASAYWEVGNDNFSKMVKPVWGGPTLSLPSDGQLGVFDGDTWRHASDTEAQGYAQYQTDSAAYDLAKRFWQDGKRDGRLPGNPWSAGSVGSKLYVPTGEALSDWEALGQVLNGSTAVGIKHKLAANNRDEQVTGANTLYGSRPARRWWRRRAASTAAARAPRRRRPAPGRSPA